MWPVKGIKALQGNRSELVKICHMACEYHKEYNTVKPVLNGHSKIDKTKILMTNCSLIKVESIAECSKKEHSAILLTCIKGQSILKTKFWSLFFEWPLKAGFTEF